MSTSIDLNVPIKILNFKTKKTMPSNGFAWRYLLVRVVMKARKDSGSSKASSGFISGSGSSSAHGTVAQVPVPVPVPATAISSHQSSKNKRFVVETITTMTTVTERRIIREAHEDVATAGSAPAPGTAAPTVGAASATGADALPPALPAKASATAAAAAAAAAAASNASTSTSASVSATEQRQFEAQKPPPIPPKETSPTQISGILKGGKLWKQDSISQVSY